MWFLFSLFVSTVAVQCKDESNTDTNSWEILKFPQSTSYVYSTDTQPSMYDLNSTTQGALANTFTQMWNPNMNYVLYNDEPPFATEYNFSVAHAKATFFWDDVSAVGIFHSIPKFPVGPDASPEYTGLLENAWEYAQHIVCVSMSLADLQTTLSVVSNLNPLVYSGSFGSIEPVTYSECYATNVGNYILFGKPASYEVDIWSNCVSPYFSTSLEVISWVHGTLDGPACGTETTLDITSISYLFGASYSNYDNHAKWGLGANPLVCFGDLNRVTSQQTRSGAVLCWKDTDLYSSLSSIVSSTNTCA